jgi:putative FmdB family regulatory protein
MPKYKFSCLECNVRFDRNLKMGEHPTHVCPSCKEIAPRVWDGQGFGFDFATTSGTAEANSGVTKHDYPTDDIAVGMQASARWQEIHAREELKRQVRLGGKSQGLIRKHAPDRTFIEYEAMTPERKEARKRLAEEAKRVAKAAAEEDQ